MMNKTGTRAAVLATSLFAVGCSGGGSSPSSPSTPSSASLIYVSDSTGHVYGFPTNSSGDVVPSIILSGSRTTIAGPSSIARDSIGNVYVAEGPSARIDVFARGANGNVAPIRSISGPNTDLTPYAVLHFDASGALYAGALKTTPVLSAAGTIVRFLPGSNGNATPAGVLTSPLIAAPQTLFGTAQQVAFAVAPNGTLYTTGNEMINVGTTINEFTPHASGSVEPIALLDSELVPAAIAGDNFTSLTTDRLGNIYVGCSSGSVTSNTVYVAEFPAASNASTQPKILPITVAPGGLSDISALVVDNVGTLYVLVNNEVQTVSPTRLSWTVYVVPASVKPDLAGNYDPSAAISTTSSSPAFATSITL